jgi:hypothetical protein
MISYNSVKITKFITASQYEIYETGVLNLPRTNFSNDIQRIPDRRRVKDEKKIAHQFYIVSADFLSL